MAFYDVTDLDSFFDDFAIPVVFNGSTGTTGSSSGVTVNAIFNETQEAVSIETAEVITVREPTLYCKTSDVSSYGDGDTVTINGVLYYVRAKLDDGTGMTQLRVSEN